MSATAADASVWRGDSLVALASGGASQERLAELFAAADADRDGVVGGADAILFFKPSGLPNATLSKVWLEASHRRGCIEDVEVRSTCAQRKPYSARARGSGARLMLRGRPSGTAGRDRSVQVRALCVRCVGAGG